MREGRNCCSLFHGPAAPNFTLVLVIILRKIFFSKFLKNIYGASPLSSHPDTHFFQQITRNLSPIWLLCLSCAGYPNVPARASVCMLPYVGRMCLQKSIPLLLYGRILFSCFFGNSHELSIVLTNKLTCPELLPLNRLRKRRHPISEVF